MAAGMGQSHVARDHTHRATSAKPVAAGVAFSMRRSCDQPYAYTIDGSSNETGSRNRNSFDHTPTPRPSTIAAGSASSVAITATEPL